MSKRSAVPLCGLPSSAAALACAVVLAALCALAAPGAALASSHGPRYELKIVSGATTIPEYVSVGSVSAEVRPQQEAALSIVRAGLTVGRSIDNGGNPYISQAPEVGDTVVFESPVGTPIASVVYDGLPTADATVCVGSTNFSGENSSGDAVEGTVIDYSAVGPYHHIDESAFQEAQVKSLSGTTFGGDFLKPIEPGATVEVKESLKTPLANEGVYTYTSDSLRPAGACPVPPAPYVPPIVPLLEGSLVKTISTGIRSLLRLGGLDAVKINQTGTVTQDLYLRSGMLPAHASARVKHALLLARGSAKTTGSGEVHVHLRLTKAGRRVLRSASLVRAVLITTLRNPTGAVSNLPRRYLTLRR